MIERHLKSASRMLTLPPAQVTLMEDDGSTREDLALPKGTEEAEKLAEQIKEFISGGSEISVTVLKVSWLDTCCVPASARLGVSKRPVRSCFVVV
jgi:hypothetical protein